MKRKQVVYTALLSVLLAACGGGKAELKSPDGALQAIVDLNQGKPSFQLLMDGDTILRNSPLGLITSNGDFASGLKLTDVSLPKLVKEDYVLPFGKKKEIVSVAEQLVCSYENAAGGKMQIEFRLSNDGLAFRYLFNEGKEAKVQDEATAFVFPAQSTGFLHPMSKAHTGWARTNPSYEEHYAVDVALATPSKDKEGWCFPALIKVPMNGNTYWALLSETGTDEKYCATHLADASTDGVLRIAYPEAAQNNGRGEVYPTITMPFQSPWRTVTVGKKLSTVVESTMATDLVHPKYEAKADYRPGKAAWSWLVLKDDHITFDVQKQFIDMASRLKFEYCLVDNWWLDKIGREKVEALATYAKEKGVSLILWYNSNGDWNDAPQTPKHCMNASEVRRKEMAWMQSIGVKGIKVDFFAGDKQDVMKQYDEILRDANEYGIAVNFHGTTLPRGWERMYPNFVSNEAVMGMEFITFDQNNADLQPQHCCLLPFTRNVVAPMDFTPLILNPTLGVKRGTGPVRKTTDAFELALPVVFFSTVQHLGLVPENLDEYPTFVSDYLAKVPTVWDETRLLDGYPGKYVAIARRSGKNWYVGVLNGENAPKEVTLDLSFAGKASFSLIEDVPEGKVSSRDIESVGKVTVSLKPNGGAVLISR